MEQQRSDPGARTARRLVVNADDFGLSASVNQAVVRAHRDGILTSASLMTNEHGFDEAVALARENPGLGIGLHLTLLCGHAALAVDRIPGLVDETGKFGSNPASLGWRYYFEKNLRAQLRDEIHEQFARFRCTGLPLDHVNGHLHMHLHPTIFQILMQDAEKLGIERLRLTSDPLRLNARLARGRWGYRLLHAGIFALLGSRVRPVLRARGIRHTRQVFGLLQHANVNEEFILRLLPALPPGDSELYSHPSLDDFRNEFDALTSPRVRAGIQMLGIQLIRYQDL